MVVIVLKFIGKKPYFSGTASRNLQINIRAKWPQKRIILFEARYKTISYYIGNKSDINCTLSLREMLVSLHCITRTEAKVKVWAPKVSLCMTFTFV